MKRIVKNTIFTLLLLTLAISTAFLAYLYFFAPGDKDLSGEWAADLDMTGQAAVTAVGWLQDIEGVTVTLEDMGSYMQGLTVEVDIVFEQTARSEGTFQCSVLPESYEACEQAAYEAFARAFKALLTERLRMAGYAGSMDDEAVEALVAGTFGMSTVDYLRSCAPALLPPIEELQAQHGESGTYIIADGILTRQSGADVKEERYIRKDASLVLFGADSAEASGEPPVIYTLKEPQDGR